VISRMDGSNDDRSKFICDLKFIMKYFSILTLLFSGSVLACDLPWFNTGTEGRKSLNHFSHGWSLSSDIVLKGRFSERFEVRPGDCGTDGRWDDCKMDRERSEIFVENPKIIPGETKFISWNVYIPEDFLDSQKVRTTLGQIHSRGGPTGFAAGLPSKPPLLQFDVFKGKYQMCWHRLSGKDGNIKDECRWFDLKNLEIMKGRWTEVIIELNTDIKKGYAKIWIDQELKVDIQEPVATYRPQFFYLKYGIYRSFVSRHGGPMPRQVAYFDEIRIGNRLDHVSTTRCNLKPVN
jgi:hypothetical protein